MRNYKELEIKITTFQEQDVITSSDSGVHVKDEWDECQFYN